MDSKRISSVVLHGNDKALGPGVHMSGATDAEGNRYRVSYIIDEDGTARNLRIQRLPTPPEEKQG